MKMSEVAKILAVVAAAYPEKLKVDDFLIRTWHSFLQDLDYEVVSTAVKKHILNSPFVPTISDIRKQAVDIITPKSEKLDAGEAWGEVVKAIKTYGVYEPSKAFESMSERSARAARYMGWQELCMMEVEKMGVARGQFIKIYDSLKTQEDRENLLPQSIKEKMINLSEKFNMGAIPDKSVG